MSSNPRVLVFAYSEVGYECLELLLRRGANIVGLFTHQDNPGEKIWFRSVASLAAQHGVPVFTPESFKDSAAEETVRRLEPDLMFSFYYRRMIPERILQLAPLGAFNMHGSLLPKYRGKAPVNWAVLHGETQTGVTLHHMVRRADAGEIVDQAAVPIGPDETAFEVMKKVQAAAVRVLDRQFEALLAGKAPRRPQDESQATYFGGRTPEDGRIDWRKPAREIFNLVRAVTRPFPGAFTDVDDTRLMIWWARLRQEPCSSGRESARLEIQKSETRLTSAATKGCEHGQPQPGEIVGLNPLTVATGNGWLEITDLSRVPKAPHIGTPDSSGRSEGRVGARPAEAGVPIPPLAIGQVL